MDSNTSVIGKIFSPHGEYHVSLKGNILVAEYSGVWNKEIIAFLHRDAAKLWRTLDEQPWAMITDARKWEGGTPEAFEDWWKFFEDAVANGMTTVTDVMPTTFYEHMVKDLADKASTKANYRSSKTIEEAVNWLATNGFNVV